MNSHTSAEVKSWSTGIVAAIVDGESQSSKEATDYVLSHIVWKDSFPGYPCFCSSDSGAVIGTFSSVIQQGAWGKAITKSMEHMCHPLINASTITKHTVLQDTTGDYVAQ